MFRLRLIILVWVATRTGLNALMFKTHISSCLFKAPPLDKQSPLIGQLTRLSHHR